MAELPHLSGLTDTDDAMLAIARTVTLPDGTPVQAFVDRPADWQRRLPVILLRPIGGRGAGHGLHEDYDYYTEHWATSRADARAMAMALRGSVRSAWLGSAGPLNHARTRSLPVPQPTGRDGMWRYDLTIGASTRA